MQLLVAALSLALVSRLGPVAPTAAAYAVASPADLAMPGPVANDAPKFIKRFADVADATDGAVDDTDGEDANTSVFVKRDAIPSAAAEVDENADDTGDDDDDDADGSEPDISSLQPRDTRHCSNPGRLTAAVGKCNPRNSKGFKSAHNCKGRGGKRYYCVQGGRGTCYTNIKRLNLENGECFA